MTAPASWTPWCGTASPWARGASLTRCVVTDGVTVPAGASFSHAILRRADGPPALDGEVRQGDLFVSSLPLA